MRIILVIRDFRCRVNKMGQPYGWPISVYSTPESLWGYEHISSAYREDPSVSRDAVVRQIADRFPETTMDGIQKMLA